MEPDHRPREGVLRQHLDSRERRRGARATLLLRCARTTLPRPALGPARWSPRLPDEAALPVRADPPRPAAGGLPAVSRARPAPEVQPRPLLRRLCSQCQSTHPRRPYAFVSARPVQHLSYVTSDQVRHATAGIEGVQDSGHETRLAGNGRRRGFCIRGRADEDDRQPVASSPNGETPASVLAVLRAWRAFDACRQNP
jgi:hypothetical protein